MVQRILNPSTEVTIAVVGKYIKYQDAYKSVYESLDHAGISLTSAGGPAAGRGRGGRARRGRARTGRRRRHAGPGRFRLSRHPRQDRGHPLCPRTAASPSSASASACSVRSSSSPATCSAWRTPTPPRSIRNCRHPGRLPARRAVRHHPPGRHDAAGPVSAHLLAGSRAHEAYGSLVVQERHRHRYEFNNTYRDQFLAARHVDFTAPAPTASWSR